MFFHPMFLLKMEVSYYDQRESEHSGELEPYASHFRSGSVNGFYRSVYDRLLQQRFTYSNTGVSIPRLKIQASSYWESEPAQLSTHSFTTENIPISGRIQS